MYISSLDTFASVQMRVVCDSRELISSGLVFDQMGIFQTSWWNTNVKAAVKHSDPRASSFAFEVTTRHHVGSISPPTDSANAEARRRENFF